MLKVIIIIVLLVLIVKYWQRVKDVSALIFATVTAAIFVLAMYLHHLFSTWYFLKRKK